VPPAGSRPGFKRRPNNLTSAGKDSDEGQVPRASCIFFSPRQPFYLLGFWRDRDLVIVQKTIRPVLMHRVAQS
jgi:hypothetical protein